MEIKQDDHGFYIGDEDHKDAEVTFNYTDDKTIDIDHTEVSEKLRGEGVAGKLVKTVVDYAREHNLKVTASCPYAKKKLGRTNEYQDVFIG
ncbi:GNAT family N-acetyltransferase [Aquisalibacillus elongatus]|uniref:Uncharacterized protein n=1 Tax=Aquisalibacillus elongatus TaxID=485577 RepID=A0A3N5C596_9BACI|nr:GNAT family N-acetyltransferase [Aquisalibacillus elongatus]RPF53345.1 hypothetical protein EDC24_1843 [Aquisalibacillus elongatus]